MKKGKKELQRSMGPWQASSLVVGTIIGTGIFLKTATMAQLLGSGSMVAAAWIISGVLSFAGALTYAELSSQFPHSGGEYAFLKAGYGSLSSFLYGWMRFWIGAPGSIAAYAAGAATFLGGIISLEVIPGSGKTVAVLLILFFSAVNCLHVHWGARVQIFLTGLKIFLILSLVIGVFGFGVSHPEIPTLIKATGTVSKFSFGTLGLAMIAALWAYDGWNNLPMVGEEVRDPIKNIPIALGIGMIVVMALYLFANASYFNVLSIEQIQTANSSRFPEALPVATLAAKTFLNQYGVPGISIAFIISALGAMNGSILTGARVPYAMARDGLFWSKLGQVGNRAQVPVISIVVQALIASGLALMGTFDQLTDYVVVSGWIFYGLTASTVFIFRKRQIKVEHQIQKDHFRVPGYPLVPILFIGAAIFLVANSLTQNPRNAFVGVFIIMAGLPFYWLMSKNKS
jgi:APA family basic amino acid/polyamine antiporter